MNRTEILRAVVADAESMGLRDKNKIEQLTARVIERLERPQTLPGMEEFVPLSHRKRRQVPSRSEIQAIVQEIIAAGEPLVKKETEPKTETVSAAELITQAPITSNKENKPMAEPITITS